MMKRRSNIRIIPALVTTVASLLIFAPAAGSALSTSNTAGSAFCANLPAKITSTDTVITNMTSRVTTAWSQQDQKLAADQQKIDQGVATARAAADRTRTADFTQLQTKATTSSERAAVQTYITAVNAAVNTRRAAYDAARHTFRISLASAISTRRTTVAAQESAFQTAVTTAFNTAQAGCTANPSNGASLRTALINSLRAARQTFQTDRKDDATIGSQIQQFIAARKAAFQAADTAFETVLQAARQALQAAFGASSI